VWGPVGNGGGGRDREPTPRPNGSPGGPGPARVSWVQKGEFLQDTIDKNPLLVWGG